MKFNYNLKKLFQPCLILFMIITVTNAWAQQTGIGTTDPKAALDIASVNEGLLIPRVQLASTDLLSPLTTATATPSKLVYNTATTQGVNGVTPGYYYVNPTAKGWIRLATGADAITDWRLRGNTITSANFLGTLNAQDLVFKTADTERMRVATTGNVGIGITNPQYKLDVDAAGGVRIQGLTTGTPADNVISIGADGVLKKITSSESSTTVTVSYSIPPGPDGVTNASVVGFDKVSAPVKITHTDLSVPMTKTRSVIVTYTVSMDDFSVGCCKSPIVQYQLFKNNSATDAIAMVQVPGDSTGLFSTNFSLTFIDTLNPGPNVYDVRAKRIVNNNGFADGTEQRQGVLSVYATATYLY